MSCSGECNSCSSTCSSDTRKSMLEPVNQFSNVKKVIGVVSGKGGVGKSLTTSYLSVLMNRKGYKTAILDADITGPSIPKSFGIHGKAQGNDLGIFPAVSEQGVKVMSVNLLLDSEEVPVVWRGPVIAGTVKQFWTDVLWEDVDYMFVDMPPGTGDVPLTVFQSLPVDGIIIVTSPQELVSMIVGKAVNMAKAMNIPILGLVENYSYIECGSCGERISVFGESHVHEVAEKYNLKVLNQVPIDPKVAAAVDKGLVEELEVNYLDATADYIEQTCVVEKEEEDAPGTERIAVIVTDNSEIDSHFAKSKKIKLYTLASGSLVKSEILEHNATDADGIVRYLLMKKANTVICGGVAQTALEQLMGNKVMVYPGCTGDADVIVATYLDNGLCSQ
ncbi:MAG: P-loop NTPase [bacterium]|nr:P-loop NTPase [bacterium]